MFESMVVRQEMMLFNGHFDLWPGITFKCPRSHQIYKKMRDTALFRYTFHRTNSLFDNIVKMSHNYFMKMLSCKLQQHKRQISLFIMNADKCVTKISTLMKDELWQWTYLLTFQTHNFLEHQLELCIDKDDELWLQAMGSTVFHAPVFHINLLNAYISYTCGCTFSKLPISMCKKQLPHTYNNHMTIVAHTLWLSNDKQSNSDKKNYY